MPYDIDAIRAEFPALHIEDQGRRRVYLDNPAGTQVPRRVVEAMSQCLCEANANLGGYFETSKRADAVVDEAHQAMADMLNAASPDEILFGQNMTSLTFAMSRSIGRGLKPGDEIVLSRMDHDANVTPWTLLAEDLGLTVRWLAFDTGTFEFDLDDLDRLLTERTRLVCVGGSSNLLGTINDIRTIAARARDAGAWSFIDAVQLVPHVGVDVAELGCDFLACSAYKFFGPHQGVLWGRRELLESLTPYKLRPAPDELPGRFETGTLSHEGMAGTTAAVDYFAWIGETQAALRLPAFDRYRGRSRAVHAALAYLFDYEKQLAEQLVRGLGHLPGVQVLGITAPEAMDRRVPTVSFVADGASSPAIARALAERNIFVWSGHNYAVEPAKALGIYESGGAVRVGPVHYNTPAEIDELLTALEEVLPAVRAA